MTIDKDIVEKLKARQESGISLLYKHYSPALYGMAFHILGRKSFAEDSLQKAFLKIWNNIDQYDDQKATFFTWMAAIVRNSALDIKRLKSFQLEEKSETLNPTVHITEKTSIDTEKIDAKKIIEGLDEKYAFVLEYLYLRGYTQSELSDEFDIPIGTIKTRVKKGMAILREKLDKEKKLFIGVFFCILLTLLMIL